MFKKFLLSIIAILFFSQPINAQNLSLDEQYTLYKIHYMSKDGRIMDPDKDNCTTSEGQSYMLLRSVLVNDKKTFDKVLKWTNDNLRLNNGLYAWLWGKSQNGDYKILDNNTATDAGVDISFALILAYEKWKDKSYLDNALLILNKIWDTEVKTYQGHKILMSGYIQASQRESEINPSYFSPYEFKKFQKYNKKNDWNKLASDSYYYLNEVCKKTKTGLPPNWFKIIDNKIVITNDQRGDFSYDAIRVFGRVLLDYKLTKDKRALPILQKVNFFTKKWINKEPFYINYKSDGTIRDKDVFIGSVAMIYPSVKIFNKKIGNEIYKKEVTPYFDNTNYWTTQNDYYGKNLLWFGEYIDAIK